MQRSYSSSQCETNFMNFYKLEKFANARLQVLKIAPPPPPPEEFERSVCIISCTGKDTETKKQGP